MNKNGFKAVISAVSMGVGLLCGNAIGAENSAPKAVSTPVAKPGTATNTIKKKQTIPAPVAAAMFSTLNEEEQTKVKELLTNNITSMKKLPNTGMQAVEVDGNLIIVSENGRFAILGGTIVDVWSMREIRNNNDLEEVGNRVNLETMGIKVKDIARYTYGTGPKEAILFIDPNCPYCHKILDQARVLGDKYTFKIVMLPLLGKQSVIDVRKMECTTNPVEAMNAMFNKTISSLSAAADSCAPSFSQRGLVVGRRLQINAVPFMIAPDGRMQKGAIDNLEQWLGASK